MEGDFYDKLTFSDNSTSNNKHSSSGSKLAATNNTHGS